jgi:hypothetical protein
MRVWRPFSFPGLRSAQGVEGGGSINVLIRNIMNQRIKSLGLALLAAAAAGVSTQAQNIGIQAVQDPTGVTVSYSGSVDLTGLTSWMGVTGYPGGALTRSGSLNGLVFNDGSTPMDTYLDVSTVPNLYDGGFSISNFTGSPFGFVGSEFGIPAPHTLYVIIGVPAGYTSGTAISGSIRLDGVSTLADLGLTAGGVTTFAMPGGNTFTVTASVVPEPSEWAAMGAGLCGAVALVRRLRQRANA